MTNPYSLNASESLLSSSINSEEDIPELAPAPATDPADEVREAIPQQDDILNDAFGGGVVQAIQATNYINENKQYIHLTIAAIIYLLIVTTFFNSTNQYRLVPKPTTSQAKVIQHGDGVCNMDSNKII